ncbi:glycosyltransferase [Lichenicola cladoniae]|uniref:Glycosyltransferase n=1 Tax=Lichenicola cladoniae TaxID=1484109 RepID=A0A6M8HSP5_9PROT|nr:glycosyltransferase [Lichenicola cladoniae]NPD65600.1 glycosyltransferase [Acetobacteraceae bacterium]QKE91362.1 glycosyltransferase [Lichenicola cladoniae]
MPNPIRVTEADRAVWREWAQERAQEAFRHGRIATDSGRPEEALRWLERARRLAPQAGHVVFPLAVARLNCGDLHGAIRLLQPLVQQFDFREGWMMLAAVRRAAGLPTEAAAAIAEALSRNAPDQAMLGLLSDIAQAGGWSGWCGLSGDGRLHLDRAPATVRTGPGRADPAELLSLQLDGAPVRAQTRKGVTVLTGDWRGGHRLEVSRGGRPLLGSPLDIQAILRVEGFVEVRDGRLTGWVWHPGEPERIPFVTVTPERIPFVTVTPERIPFVTVTPERIRLGSVTPGKTPVAAVVPGERAGMTVAMPRFADSIASDRPLARPRELVFPAGISVFETNGPLRLRGSDGRELLGSPLDPGLELRAAAAAALLQARHSTDSRRRDGRLPPIDEGAPRDPMPPFLPISAWLIGRWPAIRPPAPVAVVVPVYRHLRRTLDCLHSVLATVPANTRLVVVEDASPDAPLIEALVEMAEAGRIQLIRHAENQGFPASVNDGIAACDGEDVVLLNSDTLVAPGWLEGLRRAAYHAPDIGTVTPFSNDASILSYPDSGKRNKAPDRAGTDGLMALAASANPDRVQDIPTGNGFCLYVRRDCVDQVGLLREDLFAQGYGEENDFCLRARHLGWRHVAALGVYVAHYGNVSFGAARTELMRRNLDVLNRLHPGYNDMILAHIAADPLAPARRRFDLARWVQARRARIARDAAPRSVLLITHDQGGGVERVVRERARQLRTQGIRSIIVRPEPAGMGPDGETRDGVIVSDAVDETPYPNLRYALPSELDALVALLGAEGVLHAEWHSLLGHHASLRTVCDRLGVPYDAYVHDYAWFCQRIALVGPKGRYCGEPDIAGCEACVAIQGSNLREAISMPDLLSRSAAELKAARRVIAPSRDAASRMTRHFPKLRPDIVAWEDDRPDLSLERLAAVSSLAPRPGTDRLPRQGMTGPRDMRPGRVVVIGAIGREKGYDVLLACLADARARALPLEFVVVGHTPDDTALMDAGCLFVTGEYGEDEAVGLIRSQDADLALLPSIWPETWCFTLSLAWRAGLPTASFDIGAPAERIGLTRRGVVLPLGLPIAEMNTVLLRLCRLGTTAIPPSSAAMQPIAEVRPSSHDRSPYR